MSDLIPDVRQREAALLLMTAIDLPAPASAYAQHLINAARLLPGADIGQAASSRIDGLRRARDLIEAMLDEASK